MAKTLTFFIGLVLVITAAVEAQKVISVTNGANDKGAVWGEWVRCPAGSYAYQFNTQNDFTNILPTQDATALNSVVLFCDDLSGTNISSTLGFEGTLAGRSPSCGTIGVGRPPPLTSFRLRVVPIDAPGVTDNTAVNDIEFTCANGNVLSATGNSQGDWGEYSDNCNNNNGICGIRTLQRPAGGYLLDDTALNDVQFQCCI